MFHHRHSLNWWRFVHPKDHTDQHHRDDMFLFKSHANLDSEAMASWTCLDGKELLQVFDQNPHPLNALLTHTGAAVPPPCLIESALLFDPTYHGIRGES